MRSDLPSGTVTLLLTDIVGSTRIVAELGDGWAPLLAEHRRQMREIVARHGGVEVDTQGDAFFIAFSRASAAVSAAEEAHASCDRTGPIRVRIGIHTGEPLVADEGYVGLDVHRAARITAAGHAGQTLVSQQTRDLVPDGSFRDLGTVRLKDVGELRLFQVGDAEFAPVRAIAATNLPEPPRPLIGRELELAHLRDLVTRDDVQLVTITGPGGIGKTSLARKLGADLAPEYPDGAWFVDLSAVSHHELVAPTVAGVIGAAGSVEEALAGRTMLLVLDNFEHVVAAATTAAAWLGAAPRSTIVVTSRESLRLRFEHEYALRPLGDDVAAQLFRERAVAAAPSFRAGDAEVTALCRRLDGIPLAVELAAARVRSLTPEQLLERLDSRLAILTGGARDLPERQRTLEATITWSYDLLNPREREMFAALGVFAGGWTLAAAEDVCGAAVDDLESLSDKNLIRFEAGRFAMLETIREYAAGRLASDPRERMIRRSHARFYAEVAERARPELTGSEQEEWLAHLADNADNLRAALQWCAADAESGGVGLRVAASLVVFWYVRGLYQEGQAWTVQMLDATPAEDSTQRAGALWGAGFFTTVLGDPYGADHLTEALEMAGRIGDRSLEARALDMLGLLAFFGNDLLQARELLERSTELARDANDGWCLADSLGTLGSIYPLLGEFDLARSASSAGLALATQRRDLQSMRMSLLGLAIADRRSGRLDAARIAGSEGLEISRRLGDPFFAAYFLWVLAASDLESGQTEHARVQADEALELSRGIGAPLVQVCSLEVRAGVAVADGDRGLARRMLQEAVEVGRGGAVPGSFVAEALRRLGALDAAEGNTEHARARFEESLQLARSVSDPWAADRAAEGLSALD